MRDIIPASQKLGLAAFEGQTREPRGAEGLTEDREWESREERGMWCGWTWDLIGIQVKMGRN